MLMVTCIVCIGLGGMLTEKDPESKDQAIESEPKATADEKAEVDDDDQVTNVILS